MNRVGRIGLRVGFLVVLGGGLWAWAELRKPRELPLEIDLTDALPGDVVELDLLVSRGGHLLARQDVRYGSAGAPGLFRSTVRARRGPAEVEVTLVYATGTAHRTRAEVALSSEGPAARVMAR